MAVLTEEGAKRVRQERVDSSVIKTNNTTIINIGLTLIFAVAVTCLQICSHTREIRRDNRQIDQDRIDSINQVQQVERDRLLRISLDSIRQAILSDTSRHY
jgi:hypothetical protein